MKAWHRSFWAAVLGVLITTTSAWTGVPVRAEEKLQKPASIVRILPEQTILFSIQFMDGFRAKVTDNKTRKTTWVDLTPSREEYLLRGIYDAQGRLKKPTNGFAEQLVELIPYRAIDGSIHYVGRQIIWGINGENRIANATSVWSVKDQKAELVSLTVTSGDSDNMPSLDVFINNGFSMFTDITFVLDTKYADVTGDGIRDHVLLIGDKPGLYLGLPAENLHIVVLDGKTKQQTHASVGAMDKGVLPKLSIGPVNQDGGKNILVTIPTEHGNVYSAISWKDSHPVVLIDQAELNNPQAYKVVTDTHGVGFAVQKAVPAGE
ncbi:hypothetical protein NDK47_02695 [Brevibacillus ruminantium]|uniref:Copper amine oxidase n=1 Tax=Brevibacillus ruminantium TaxID=2950604 RepID=A0ABY4WGQ3_9BACL|nr:hypothetical protein [Brevibacillus ruminantium]USG66262.1 hypothetical protein NDK47_02695 [Brevibacillus ruminantium]